MLELENGEGKVWRFDSDDGYFNTGDPVVDGNALEVLPHPRVRAPNGSATARRITVKGIQEGNAQLDLVYQDSLDRDCAGEEAAVSTSTSPSCRAKRKWRRTTRRSTSSPSTLACTV